jgi:fibronectin type 3 domain-containing protein
MATPLTLGAGQSSSLNVTFAPTSSGPLNGAVHLTDNSPTPNVTISVSGTGVAALSPQVTLSWSESSSGVSGYNVYRSLVTGGSYTKLNPSLVKATSYTDQNVTAGNTYFYVFTSVGTNNAESGYSAQVEAIVP